MGVNNYGSPSDPLSSPSLVSWAASVAAAFDARDVTVDTRLALWVPISATAPSPSSKIWFDTSTLPPTIKGWDGSDWVEIGGGGTPEPPAGDLTTTDHGDGTATLEGTGVTDYGNGQYGVNSTNLTDNGDGTFTTSA